MTLNVHLEEMRNINSQIILRAGHIFRQADIFLGCQQSVQSMVVSFLYGMLQNSEEEQKTQLLPCSAFSTSDREGVPVYAFNKMQTFTETILNF